MGCLTSSVHSSAQWAIPWTAPAPAWDGWWMTSLTRNLLCSGYSANLTEWKEQMLSCSSLPQFGWTAQTVRLQTFMGLLLVGLNSSRNCCGDEKPWQKYLWECSCLKPKELFSNQLMVLFNNVSRKVSYPSNSLKLAGAFSAKRHLQSFSIFIPYNWHVYCSICPWVHVLKRSSRNTSE